MAEAKKNLIDRFNTSYFTSFVLQIVAILLIVVLIIWFIVRFKKMIMRNKLIMIVTIIITTFLGICNAKLFNKYTLDYEYLKINGPIQIEGKLAGFAGTSTGDYPTKILPIILIKGTNEMITLNIPNSEERLKENHIYTFFYLPNTMYAEFY